MSRKLHLERTIVYLVVGVVALVLSAPLASKFVRFVGTDTADADAIVSRAAREDVRKVLNEAAAAHGVCYDIVLHVASEVDDVDWAVDSASVRDEEGSCPAGTVELGVQVTWRDTKYNNYPTRMVLQGHGLDVPSVERYVDYLGYDLYSGAGTQGALIAFSPHDSQAANDEVWRELVGALPLVVSERNPELEPPFDEGVQASASADPAAVPGQYAERDAAHSSLTFWVSAAGAAYLLFLPLLLYLTWEVPMDGPGSDRRYRWR